MSQLAARSPCGTGSHTVPGGCLVRWMSFSTCDCCGSMRLVIPPRATRLCVFALKSAHPAGGPFEWICAFASVSSWKSGSGRACVGPTFETGASAS